MLSSNSELRTSSSKNEKDTHDIVLYFQREIEMKDDIIARLNEELVKRETQLKFEVERIRKKADSDVYEIQSNSATTIDALKVRLDEAERELNLVDLFRTEKNENVAALAAALAANEDLERTLSVTVETQERKFLEEKAQLYRDMEAEKVLAKEQALKDARATMSRDVQKVYQDNLRMHEEIKFHKMMADELLAEKKAAEDSLVDARRDLQILRDNEEAYLKQGLNRAKEVKALRERVEQLEKQQIVNVERFKARTKELQNNVHKELEDAMLDAAGLRRLIKIKNKELRTMKTLSATILSQRNDIEQFFLEALAEVREHLKVERKKEKQDAATARSLQWTRQSAAAQTKPGLFPSIKGMGSVNLDTRGGSELPVNPDDKVLVRDLSWGDKELVLRVLFAKINGQQKMVDHAVGHAAKKPSGSIQSPRNRAVFVSEGLDFPDGEVELFQKNFEMFGGDTGSIGSNHAGVSPVNDDSDIDLDEDALMMGSGCYDRDYP